MLRKFFAVGILIALSACTDIAPVPQTPVQQPNTNIPSTQAARMFLSVVARVEPIAERECLIRSNIDCDFQVLVHEDASLPPNAFQTFDNDNRPIVVFTQSLIADVQNADELAFILSHEAGHLIRGHIPRTQQNAQNGAILGGAFAAILGLGEGAVQAAVDIGGMVGSRRFSKNFELEADEMGTIIATSAGYDALRGAQYFTRIPDPGDQFLGSHPANHDRIETVRRTMANM